MRTVEFILDNSCVESGCRRLVRHGDVETLTSSLIGWIVGEPPYPLRIHSRPLNCERQYRIHFSTLLKYDTAACCTVCDFETALSSMKRCRDRRRCEIEAP